MIQIYFGRNAQRQHLSEIEKIQTLYSKFRKVLVIRRWHLLTIEIVMIVIIPL